MQYETTLHPASRTHRNLSALVAPLLGAMLLGAVIVYGVGFSPIAAAHNAAHDTRHAHVFPCH